MIIGMVSTRFSGLDGVSLESAKVATALERDGHEFVWFAGELGPEFQPGLQYRAAHFATDENRRLQAACFGRGRFTEQARDRLDVLAADIEDALYSFVSEFNIDALIIQNASAIPMQLPLGLAVAAITRRLDLPVVGHHHDFGWERERFGDCAVPEVLDSAFPPVAPNYAHVVINREARDALWTRRTVDSVVLPNVMDFAGERVGGDGAAFRVVAGMGDDDVLLLQPTRVIPRKGIELTIDLAHRLADPRIKIVVSHADDLDTDYWRRLEEQASDLGVDLRLAPAGSSATNLADAYAAADLVCFPSFYEGFGNALVEAFYYRKPVFVNRYPVYRRDIAPTGVECAEIEGEVTTEVVEQVGRWVAGDAGTTAALDHNYEVGVGHFSYDVVRSHLGPLLAP